MRMETTYSAKPLAHFQSILGETYIDYVDFVMFKILKARLRFNRHVFIHFATSHGSIEILNEGLTCNVMSIDFTKRPYLLPYWKNDIFFNIEFTEQSKR